MNTTAAFFFLAIAAGLLIATPALAQDSNVSATVEVAELEPPSVEAMIPQAGELVASVRAGDWRKTAALVLSLLVAGLLRLRKMDWLKDWLKAADYRSIGFVFGMSGLGALSTSLLGSQPVDLAMFKAAGIVGAYAVGGYAVIWKKLALPLLKFIKSKF